MMVAKVGSQEYSIPKFGIVIKTINSHLSGISNLSDLRWDFRMGYTILIYMSYYTILRVFCFCLKCIYMAVLGLS